MRVILFVSWFIYESFLNYICYITSKMGECVCFSVCITTIYWLHRLYIASEYNCVYFLVCLIALSQLQRVEKNDDRVRYKSSYSGDYTEYCFLGCNAV